MPAWPATSFSRAAATWRCARPTAQYAQKNGHVRHPEAEDGRQPEVEKLIGAANFEIQVVANRPGIPEYLALSGTIFDGYHHLQTSFEQVGRHRP